MARLLEVTDTCNLHGHPARVNSAGRARTASEGLQDIPPYVEHPTHNADGDLHPRCRDIDDAAYRDVSRLRHDPVRMATRVVDGAPLVGPCGLPLRRAELSHRHLRHLHRRGAITIKAQLLRDGRR